MDRFRKLPFSKKALPMKVVISYFLDYVIIVALVIGFGIIDKIEPFHQHFSLTDIALQYPFAVHERVPIPLLYFVSIVCPVGIIVLYTLILDGLFSHHKDQLPLRDGSRVLGRYRLKDRLWEMNCGILGLLLSLSSAFILTEALKKATGKPRPDLIDRCQPLSGSHDPPVFGLSNITICTQTDSSILQDGFQSFPSGHSSTSFSGLFFLSLYLAGKLHIFDNRGEIWKTYIVMVPTLGAGLVAISRIEDARHHGFDVITGSLLGVFTAYIAYRQYFPPLSEAWRKGRAFPIRSWGSEPTGPDGSQAQREVIRDRGVEPMRKPTLRVDEEQNVSLDTPGLSDGGVGSNVFRKQVSNVERMRSQHAGPSSYSAPLQNIPPIPTSQRAPAGRSEPRDYWSSSEDGDDEDAFEMQPRPKYTLAEPPSHTIPLTQAGYSNVSENFGQTAYNPHQYTEEQRSSLDTVVHQPDSR